MIIAVLALLGVILGSFVNALVWRLHEHELLADSRKRLAKKAKKPAASRQPLTADDLSILKGRSMCPSCHHELAAKDLVPVLSWLWLRGRCRYCSKPISWQYPAVELLTSALFVVSYLSWPFMFNGVWLFQFVLWLGFLTMFVALAVYDLRWFLLPDKLVLPVTVAALAEAAITALWLHSVSALWQPAAGAAIIFGVFWLLYQVSKGAWIGGGDVKLAIALGALAATPLKAFLVIFFASLIGTLVSIPLLMKGKKGLKVHIPFGPHLLLATVVVALYGDQIVNWYKNLLVP